MINKTKILLIDDEEDFCFFVKKNLEETGDFSVIYTTNPNKAMRLARKESPDLILMDIKMPRRDGFKVLEAIKKDRKTLAIPVVMLTAVGEEEAKIKAAQLYNDDYLTKPVSVEALRFKIDAILKRGRGIYSETIPEEKDTAIS